MLRAIVLCVVAAALSACAITNSRFDQMAPSPSGDAPASKLSWEVLNRDRLLVDEDQEQRFHKNLASYITEYREWYSRERTSGPFANILNSDLLHGPRVTSALPVNFKVRYDPVTGSYRCAADDGPACARGVDNWITDPRRIVRLSFGSANESCDWTVDGEASTGPCSQKHIDAQLDKKVHVGVRRRSDGATDTTDVLVRDLKIVALGDSFSAGEGNPHTQWRYYFTRRQHPALWLDSRCHRSLMSGPSLTTAYLARQNTHMTFTLLHYGCSGASIADGLVTPWAHLETSADIREQFAVFHIEDEAYTALRVAGDGALKEDVSVTQIEQAERDLATSSGHLKPDVVLVQIGGNDVGFADLVHGVMLRWGLATDLKLTEKDGKEVVEDNRYYSSFDEESWVKAARVAHCGKTDDQPKKLKTMDCMRKRVQERLHGSDGNVGAAQHATLDSQYAALAARLQGFADPAKIYVVDYPNFVMREPDHADPHTADPDSAVGCVDRPFDGRPGFVPGILAWLPGVGLRNGTAEEAGTDFLNPLNATLEKAAGDYSWQMVKAHVHNGRGHGYCSLERYYNTLTDSYWNQGRRYDNGRPLGNLVVLKPTEPFADVRTMTWSADQKCFVAFPATDGACLVRLPDTKAAMELQRDASANQTAEQQVDKANIWGSTGMIHPNLFGHCNYAGAMIAKIVQTQPGWDWDAEFKTTVAKAGDTGLTADAICDAQAWGYKLVPKAAAH